MKQILAKLAPPHYDLPEKARRAELLNAVSLVLLVILTFLLLFNIFYETGLGSAVYPVLLGLILCQVAAHPKEFASYWDLTQPKWRGKITATDPRTRGMDNPVLFFYYHAKLGPEFIRKLYGDMEVAIARDYRQPVDWLASGRYAICIPCVSDEMDKAMDQGLPVGQVMRLKEGGTLSSSGGTLTFLQNAPHPNAAKVFVNWLLSREGQTVVQKGRKGRARTASNSLRTDIAKNDLPEEVQRRDGVDYFDADDDSVGDRRPADKLFNEIFGKTAK